MELEIYNQDGQLKITLKLEAKYFRLVTGWWNMDP